MSSSTARNALLAASIFVVLLMVGGGVAVRVGAAEGTYRNVITFSEILGLVRDNYVDPVEEQGLLVGAYEGLLASLDGRGAYLTPADVAAWKAPRPGSAAETGLSVLKAGSIVQVVAVAAGSPAEGAGLKPGDQLRRIDGRPVRALAWDQVVRALAGEAGSTVRLGLVQPREGFRRKEIDLRRANLKGTHAALRVDRGVAVATLGSLGRFDPEALRGELRKARAGGATTLLLDLRSHVDGSPRAVAAVAGLLTTGTLLVLKDKVGQQVESVVAKGDGSGWTGDVAVLVNGGTAGAAEALALLLQSRRTARIYGEATFGLGAELRLVELADGGGLLIPALAWETDAGKRWNEDGVKPDREVRAEYRGDAETEDAEAEQLRRTIDEIVRDQVVPEAAAKAA